MEIEVKATGKREVDGVVTEIEEMLTFDFGDDCDDAIAKFSKEVVFSGFRSDAKIELQAKMRQYIKKGLDVQTLKDSWKPSIGAVQPLIYFLHDRNLILNAGSKYWPLIGLPLTLMYYRKDQQHLQTKQEKKIDWITGCAFMIRSSVLKLTGNLKEKYFIYFEDVDLSFRIKKAGYGFRSLSLVGNEGDITITGIRDMSDSEIYILDWDAMKFHGDKFMERKRHDGREYFLERDATNGYQYLVDVKFYGDLVLHNPSHCGVIHSISY